MLNDKPLTGKYAKLRDDLKAAMQYGRLYELDGDDGGTCNFDSPALYLPRWNAELVKQAAKEAGSSCFIWHLFKSKLFVFRPDTACQANGRSRNAEMMRKYLETAGYDAMDYCQAD